ncbi:hypothetical protein [Spirosoma terrae]|uniref:Uncharacterized protein n=1 Tax=Spirosoma terrae TaxID=1968276 RepID=A0A6L9L3P4_9BACT|nr:hypothetical protein [Spirosoma terrae]NDU94082.1 hypothetical protein [Spirosoma terrae]
MSISFRPDTTQGFSMLICPFLLSNSKGGRVGEKSWCTRGNLTIVLFSLLSRLSALL